MSFFCGAGTEKWLMHEEQIMLLKGRVYRLQIWILLASSVIVAFGCNPLHNQSETMQLMFFINSGDLRNIGEIRRLIKAGADLNSARTDGYALLHIASQNGNAEVVRMLLEEEQTNVEQVTVNGDTALFLASGNGHVEVVKLLLAANADVNRICPNNFTGYTPLTTAVYFKHDEVVKLLKEHGAYR